MRGIAFDDDNVYLASSDELLCFSKDFEFIDSWRAPFLKDCHGIERWNRTLYLASAAYDSVVGFDLDEKRFNWAMSIQERHFKFRAAAFDPMSDDGPLFLNKLHIDSIHCSSGGMYVCGSHCGGLLHFNGKDVNMAVQLPHGCHDAIPFRDGVLFNDTESNVVRYTGRGDGAEDRAMPVPEQDLDDSTQLDRISEGVVRPRYGKGLAVLSDHIIAAGSTPATVALYDLAANETLGSVRIGRDVRNTIHTLIGWPYSDSDR